MRYNFSQFSEPQKARIARRLRKQLASRHPFGRDRYAGIALEEILRIEKMCRENNLESANRHFQDCEDGKWEFVIE